MANRKLIFETVLSDDKAKFARGKADLPDEAKAAIDQMVAQVKSQKANIWVEIEGHTDNTGDAGLQPGAGSGPRRGGEAVSLRAAPGAAAQDERHQLRRREAGDGQQDPRQPHRRTAAWSSRCSRRAGTREQGLGNRKNEPQSHCHATAGGLRFPGRCRVRAVAARLARGAAGTARRRRRRPGRERRALEPAPEFCVPVSSGQAAVCTTTWVAGASAAQAASVSAAASAAPPHGPT